jgi:hypothetical protein
VSFIPKLFQNRARRARSFFLMKRARSFFLMKRARSFFLMKRGQEVSIFFKKFILEFEKQNRKTKKLFFKLHNLF